MGKLTAHAQQIQANEIARRLDQGETVQALADEYGISRITIWRRANQGFAATMPDKDDDSGWRDELTAVLTQRIVANSVTGDDKALVPLIDRLAKLNGYDHAHRMDVARLRLDAARVQLIAERMETALTAAGLPRATQVKVLEQLAAASG